MFQGGAARAALLLVVALAVAAHGKPPDDRPVDVSSAVLEMGPEETDLGEGMESSNPGGQVKWCQDKHDTACKEAGKCGTSKITGVGKCGERVWCLEGVNGKCYDSSEALFKGWTKQTKENCLTWAKNKDLSAPDKKKVVGSGTCAQRVNGVTCANTCGKPAVSASTLPAKKQLSLRLTEKTEMRMDNYTVVLSMKSTSSTIGHEKAKGNVTCGDGHRQGVEECDDGNADDGDGCSKTCTVEGGYACDTKVEGNRGDKCYACKPTQCTILYNKSFRCMSTKPSKEKLTQEKIMRRKCLKWKRQREILLKKKLTKKASALLIQWRAKKMNKRCRKVFQQKSKKAHSFRRELRHARASSGFCKCAKGYCSEGGASCKRVGQGWYRDPDNGQCKCGLGFCLLPFAKQTLASPNKYHCAKVNKNMIRGTNSSLCQCAGGHDAVVSDDPVKARAQRGASCKAVPSTPVKTVKHQGAMFAQFTCMGAPYVKGNTTETCDDCAPTACKMPRPGVMVSHVNRSQASNASNPFYCVSKTVMEQMQMKRDAAGMCQCSADECLKPHRDSFRCAPLAGSHPYGGVKLSDGKCGCTDDADSCIMPTHPAGFGSPGKGFQCLKLKMGGAKTRFGKHYFRGKTGECKCVPSRCRAGPTPTGVGAFKCLDVEKNSAYRLDPAVVAAVKAGTSKLEDVPCQCAQGACTVPGAPGLKHDCMKCPTKPGSCRARCAPDGNSCIKYCSTKHVKLIRAPGSGINMDKSGKLARVIRCFITKNVKCVEEAAVKAPAAPKELAKCDGSVCSVEGQSCTQTKGWCCKNKKWTEGRCAPKPETVEIPKRKKCSQKISARVEFDCPGKYSEHSNRKLQDGTQTYGFKSVCSRQNYECQRAKCDTTAPAAVCLEKMMLT